MFKDNCCLFIINEKIMTETESEIGCNPEEEFCRDFLRNVCSRGRKCRYKHYKLQFSDSTNSTKEERLKFIRMFCHDFQNTACAREECKFIHCSKEDQDFFSESGSLPGYVVEDAIAKSFTPSLPDQNPVCRDYLSGECRRGKTCRFRHLSHSNYRKELDSLYGAEQQPVETAKEAATYEYSTDRKRFKASPCVRCAGDVSFVPMPGALVSQGYCPHNGFYYTPERCSVPVSQNHFNGTCRMGHPATESQIVLCGQPEPSISLQDENTLLKKRVMDLKRQLSDLTAANEFLLDQNAQLRMGRKNGAVTPVSVTMQPIQPMQSMQPMPQAAGQQQLVTTAVPVSIAPGTLAGGVPASGHAQQIVNAPAQQILSTGALSTVTVSGQTSTGQLVTAVPVSCNATGQIMAAVSTVTVAGQNAAGQQLMAAAVPVSCTGQPLVPAGTLTTPATQQLVPVSCTATGQQLPTPLVSVSSQQLVPVSLATAVPVSISAVSVAPPIVTMAQGNAPPHGQSLVSYPIMTHAVLQTSLQR